MSFSRRDFLCSGLCLAAAALARRSWAINPGESVPGSEIPPKEALYWDSLGGKRVECKLCPKKCQVDDLERGYCGVRENNGGTYFTHVYGAPCSVHTDPIEKKPFYHFLPGTDAFSLATAGCNMDCAYCQNWEISQVRPEQVSAYYLPPRSVAQAARDSRAKSVAFTYTEPVVFYEYMFDSAGAARDLGLRSVMVSNGYINEEPLRKLCGVLDGIKVDLKAFREKFYKEVCAGELKPVLDSLELIHREKVWLEIVYLMIPTLNDSETEITELCGWVKEKLGPDVPVHFTRFHPQYRLTNLPSTPVELLERALRIARSAGINYVYLGNVVGHETESTRCPSCGKVVVRRIGYTVLEVSVNDGKCKFCGTPVAGVWS